MKRLIVLAVLALGACRAEVEATVYFRDIIEIEAGESIMLPARIAIQVPGRQGCIDDGPDLRAILQNHLHEVGEPVCEEEGFDDYAVMEFALEMTAIDADGAARPHPAVGYSVMVPREGDRAFAMAINKGRLDGLLRELSDRFHQRAELDDLNIALRLVNDTRAAQDFWIRAAFLDRQPVVDNTRFTMPARGEGQLILSNVMVQDLVHDDGSLTVVLSLVTPEEES